MELSEAIKNRRSIRSYKKQELSKEIITQLIEAARQAPSAGNGQPWEFVVATKQETKQALSAAALSQRSLIEASAVIIVCADLDRAEESYGARGRSLYCIQDTAAATENIHLAAVALGLGTCWIGAFSEEKVAEIIKAPSQIRPVAMITVGYPNQSPPARPRRPIAEILHSESF